MHELSKKPMHLWEALTRGYEYEILSFMSNTSIY